MREPLRRGWPWGYDMRYFSPSTKAFYDSNINSHIPQDVHEITPEHAADLLKRQSSGAVITSDPYGQPVAMPAGAFFDLGSAQAAKVEDLTAAYSAASQQDVTYLGNTFQADNDSQMLLAKVLACGAVPDDFYWVDVTNSHIPMNFDELRGLAQAMLASTWPAFKHLQDRKQAVMDAASNDVISVITW
jgi:hypothetical protein